ncbi:hypothetical protein B834_798 [Enterococcus mundtii 1A]|uniref:Uncharacterized protein n=1 Tax=Enterococcus mundtii TaxID=53346 RepID=A0AAI8R8Q3_ENTMU|nr:hypothetical protein [Enterococcus mundtii]EYT97051.1 hypothetical protein AK89_00815 [Enterococcus mundtii CRL35]MDA9428330.1 hypothetical protein [Enterococcus mundtii 1A]BAO07950.1 hypothetical protein EMQU_2393 [Enterococcus mundtii QU 25]BBM14279.1 uncharacterized protein EM151A_1042 [Enterococcus mundtii]GKS54988.1 hypothetical protein EMLAB_16030 [Enterococcus mundtii]
MKELKMIFGAFLLSLLLNWGLSYLLNRPFKWWITLGMFFGFSIAYLVGSRKSSKNK